MKALSLLVSTVAAITFSGLSAHAQSSETFVATHGEFVASECGATAVDSQLGLSSTISQICIGQTAALGIEAAQPAVQFVLKNGNSKVFSIAHVDNLLMALLSGKTKSIVFLVSDDGEQVAMKVINSKDGKIESAQGAVAGHPFFVKAFDPLLHTM